MLTVYSPAHQRHNPSLELLDGKYVSPVESPQRVSEILQAIATTQLGPTLEAQNLGLEAILRIHDADYVEFLSTAWSEWVVSHGTYDALPLSATTRSFRSDRRPRCIEGKLSYYSFDAGTPLTAGTWDAAIASAHVALTAQAHLEQGSVFALCRPPGHHATQNLYGGYCFLNNAAIAAQALRDRGAERVAILDIDYHHGNGTQSIFYDRSDVLFLSIHADPADDYPFFSGYADEGGIAQGDGFNHNYPLPLGTQWHLYQDALHTALHRIRQFGPDALVISLGVDTFEGDPIAKFCLHTDDYRAIGALIASLSRPVLFVMEGGYAMEAIGQNVVALLRGYQDHA